MDKYEMKQFEKLTVRVLKNKYGNIILTQNEYHDELHRLESHTVLLKKNYVFYLNADCIRLWY